ncbi:WD repeat and HMG-box DNA-binding protein 1-like [Limulus polyphemus]|uniref:WD repeat and HMG-box DNA-binding protein 1-like n=1 Tax=Limulus polyphemus TaxID=6850 RepID=A0ABM1BC48_LIMPO|nr:WD repeat and HMG-box DNA-binding protein 1-like [Limulus polyphemus]XP_022246760.1 WD repeat and HMG-box DNA-binding protein 1-like [Limulus polyphemus]XP_022246761.1 WD repeat and HMG-box DNA-binding protein 1-like [Limulus polyphemus]
MPAEKKYLRYAHCEGYTDLCYDSSSNYVLTCGGDGDVRIWEGFENNDPITHHVGNCATAILFTDKRFLVATDNNSIQAYTFPNREPDGIITRFTSPVHHMCCSSDGKIIVAGSGDFTIKIVDIAKNTQKCLYGHQAPILSVALDPKCEYLASSSCDGSVRIWKVSSQDCIKMWTHVPKSNDFCMSKTLCRMTWSKDGKYLALPVEKEVHLYKRGSWENMQTLKDESVTEIISLVALSPCGSFMAAVTVDGRILVWEMTSGRRLESIKLDKGTPFCSIAWNPTGKMELVFSDTQGQLGLIGNIGIIENESISADSKTVGNKVLSSLSSDSDDEDRSDSVKLSNDVNDDEIPVVQYHSKKLKAVDDDDNDENVVDIGAIKATYDPVIFGEDDEDSKDTVEGTKTKIIERIIEKGPPPPLKQEAFQPGSTPVHLQHRFMLWNSVGIVRCYNTEEENAIDVEFHDTAVHHPIHVTNVMNHKMAALSNDALMLACGREENVASKLVCMHFGTWDSSKDWTVEMPEEEEVVGVAVGEKWTAVTTNTRIVRIFTIGGIQREIFCLPGPLVCMTGLGVQLLLIYHQAAGIPGEQSLAMMIFKVEAKTQSRIPIQPVALSPKATVVWAGFTDEGTPCTVDSSGVVRLLSLQNMWVPVANTKSHTKGKSDHFFVVGMSEIQQQIRCIPCKGSRYPPTLPRPAVTVLPLHLPTCDMSSNKGKLEEECCRLALLSKLLTGLSKDGFDVDKELEDAGRKRIDVLLRMFALATRSDQEYRAVEIAQLMPTQHAVKGAISYASQSHHMMLAQRLGEIAQKKLEEESLVNKEESDSEEGIDENSEMNRRDGNISFVPNDDEVLQPKPVVLRSHHSLVEEAVREDTSDDKSNTENDMLLQSKTQRKQQKSSQTSVGHKRNPFKLVVTKEKRGSVGIDGILTDGVKQLSSTIKDKNNLADGKKKKTQQQLTLLGKNKPTMEYLMEKSGAPPKKKTAFQLFFDKNKPSIAEENPELEESDLVKEAVLKFKELPSEDKEMWNQKSSLLDTLEQGENDANIKKRKRTERECDDVIEPQQTNQNKKPLSHSTALKLSQFAFDKDCSS